MVTSLKWIKAYVPDLDVEPQEYMDAMTLSGSKVEGYKRLDEDLEKIFAPYYTTKADKGVSGLGLFLAKRVLNLHGASIDIDSIVGRGTRITVTFPTPESAT